MRSAVGSALTVMILLAGSASVTSAQVGERATLTGTVVDSQGAVVPGASVTATHAATNVETTAVSNESGVYLLSSLTAGKYKVTFALSGFQTAVREVEVRNGERVRIDHTMAIGAMTEQVQVTAQTPLLETATASRGKVIDQEKVENLPMSGRNPFTLAHIAPGVTGEASNRQSIQLRPFDNGGMDNISINGGRLRSNEFLLDGAPNANNEGGGSNTLSFVPSPDAVQEVRVETNTYDAQYGRTGGGVISVSLRSGTNEFRGTGYFYKRDEALNESLYENKINNLPKTKIDHTQPGFTIGGPMLLPRLYDGRNKTFFFYAYEHLKSAIPTGGEQRAPTALERAGDFSQSGVTIFDPLSGQPFPGNLIPDNRIDPVSRALLTYMPLPNGQRNAAGNNFFPNDNRADIYDSNALKIDHNIGNSRFSARYAHNGRHEIRAKNGREEVAAGGGNHFRWNDQIAGDLSTTFGATLLSSLKAGWVRHKRIDRPYGDGVFDSSVFPYSSGFLAVAPKRFLPVSITDFNGSNVGDGGGGFLSDSHEYFLTETMTKLRGRHQIKFGGEFRHFRDEIGTAFQSISVANFSFTRNWTSSTPSVANPAASAGGSAFASFLLGYPQFSATNPSAGGSVTKHITPAFNWRANYYGAFLQDDWRLTRRWTVNLGVRWDYESPVTEANNYVNYGFNTTAVSPLQVTSLPELRGGLLFGSGPIYKKDLNNWGPRFGTTYQVSEKMVVRGGYGLTYLPSVTDRGTTQGFSITTPLVTSTNSGITPSTRLGTAYSSGVLEPAGASKGLSTFLGQNVTFQGRDRDIPEYHQYSVGFQYQLPWRSMLDVAYVGSRTNKMGVNRQINDLSREQLLLGDALLNAQVANPFAGLLPDAPNRNGATVARRELLRPYPQFGTIQEQLIPIGYLRYNALQASWDKRLSHGVNILVSYTFSRSEQATSPLNQGEPLFLELTPTHRPHVLRLSGGWAMPELANRNSFLRYVAGGWQIQTVTTLRSGITIGMPDNVDVIGDPVLDHPTRARWFNTCTLTAAGARQYCTSPDEPPVFQIRQANALDTTGARLEGVYQHEPFYIDFSVFKNVRVNRRVNLQFRAELFNAANAVQWGAPGTNVNTATTFGIVGDTQANDPRNIMVSFRVSY